MRLTFGLLFLFIIIAMAVCTVIARHSGKRIGFTAAGLLTPLMLTMAGNMILILSGNRVFSLIGCYVYYIGLDISLAALLHFAHVYCRIEKPRAWFQALAFSLLTIDVVQLLLNIFFHHAFDITAIEVDGFPYYRMIPYAGQQFHRAVDYLLLAGIIIGLIIRMVRAPRLQKERYSVILLALILVTGWETANIFSGMTVDRSMIGFGVFGLLIFYFSLYYKPMRLLDRMLSRAVSERINPIFFFDEDKECIWMNHAGGRVLNLEEHELEKAGTELRKQFGSLHPDLAEWQDHVTMEVNGTPRLIELTKQPVRESGRKIDGFYFYMRDLTDEQREAAQKLYDARHDRLTGLYNRDYLYDRTREVLANNPDEPYLIIMVQISDLKVINDLYGNTFGDFVLKNVAEWLRGGGESLDSNTVYGRLGGDRFGICVPEKHYSRSWMEEELAGFSVRDDTREFRLLIHVGIYRITDRDMAMSVMYDRAMLAVESIKDDYHFHIAWYDESMRDRVARNRLISGELSDALKEELIRPWLQSIVDREGKTVGAEALVRWIHPDEGVRVPLSFIPMFEKNGMIAEVDRFIWRKACEILARWKRQGKDLFISVNISTRDFYLMNVPSELMKMTLEYGIEPERLRLEITESVMMNDQELQMDKLRKLQDAGFIIEMDDFGSGYSSLNMLREMPVDVLKIDMAFLRQADRNPRARTIIEQVITMTGKLGIVPLTEGVETKEQFDTLREMGCQLFQGYYFAKPMPVEEFEKNLPENGRDE